MSFSLSKEVVSVLQKHCGKGRRLAVDKIQIHGLRALENSGIIVFDGEELMEKTRSIKGNE